MSIRARVDDIGNRADALQAKIEKDGLTQRDVAELIELYALQDDAYSDIQDECVNGKFSQEVVVKVDGATIKFPNINSVSEWIYGR